MADAVSLQCIWAKSALDGAAAVDGYHPLLLHMFDTAIVARLLWRSCVAPSVRSAVAAEWRLDESIAETWVAFLAGSHDVGKASPGFQVKWPNGCRLLPPHLTLPPASVQAGSEIKHGEVTAWALKLWLRRREVSERTASALARAVGGHHGTFVSNVRWDGKVSLFAEHGGAPWRQVRDEHLDLLADLVGVGGESPQGPVTPVSLVVLAGHTSVADWLASDERFFPHGGAARDISAYVSAAAARAEWCLAELGLSRPKPVGEMDFFGVFGRKPRELQTVVEQARGQFRAPLLAILEAPTGVGKTEAALYLAESLARQTGESGLYIGMPTMATANQMFTRLRTYLARRFDSTYLQLLHSQAALSDEFQTLLDAQHATPSQVCDDERAPSDGVVAGEWFLRPKRALLASHGVGTVDSALSAGLFAKHFFVRLYGLAGKTVIFDEVHAYDAYMLSIFQTLLGWLGALSCNVIILSATLSRGVRESLMRAYAPSCANLVDQSGPYPRLTWVGRKGQAVQSLAVPPGASRTIEIDWRTENEQSPKAYDVPGCDLAAALVDGGCAAIICNTVGEAQSIFRALKPWFPGEADDGEPELDLLHARFVDDDRRRREQRVVRRFGPDPNDPARRSPQRPRRAVLVATQVIEQSLDLDFDLMVSALAPIDLLIQRVGRLWRFPLPMEERPPALRHPHLWLRTPDLLAPGQLPIPGSWQAVYDPHILLRSWLSLRGRGFVELPRESESLVESVYAETPPPESLGDALRSQWNETRAAMGVARKRDAEDALRRSIAAPGDLSGMFSGDRYELAEDDPSQHPALQALTRLGDPSVSVVLLEPAPPAGLASLLTGRLDREHERYLLGRSVRITHRGLVQALIRRPPPSGWRHFSLLRHHREVELGPAAAARVGENWRLCLDPEVGVVISRLKPGENG